jgi:DNA-binding CsgD family transcriptional regulator
MMDMGLRAASPVMVGRHGEMARLVKALDVAVEGGSAVALVGGEAGVGKSRLVQELAAVAGTRGFHVYVGRCLEFGEAAWPLAPLSEIVATLVDELDDDMLDFVVGDARGVLARLAPALGAGTADAAESSEQLCELAIGVFGRLARRRPLILVVEDLHWADDTTRTLFSALARAERVRPLLLVGTFRSDELHRRHPLRPMLAEIERGCCERIEVRPLDRPTSAELIAAIHGSAVDRRYVDSIHRRSAGNPFFLEELVAAHRSGVGDLPDTLRDVILARAAALDESAVDVLGVAAAAGPTTAQVLGDVSRLDAAALQTTLGELVATALLVPDGDELRFRHELGREIFYDELLPGQRAGLHARLAESLQTRRPERLGEIAHHWSAANDTPRALATSVAAGGQTLRTGAAAEAEGHLDQALELWNAVEDAPTLTGLDHPALLLEAATAAEHARHLDRAIDLASQAAAELATVDPLREGEAWLLLRNLYRFTQRWDDCADAVTRALALIPESPPSKARAAALAFAALGDMYAKRPNEAMAFARQSVTVAEAVGEPDILVEAENALAAALYATGDHQGALAVSMACLNRCGAAVPPGRALTAYNGVLNSLAVLGRYAEIPTYARRGVELARSTGLGGPKTAWIAFHWMNSFVVLGRWADAERLAGEVADLLDHQTSRGELAVSWAVALIRQGRLDEAGPLIEQARTGLFRTGRDVGSGFVAAAIVEFDAAEGRPIDAERLVTTYLHRRSRWSDGDVYLVAAGVGALADWAQNPPSAADAMATATRWLELIGRPAPDEPDPAVEQSLYRVQLHAQLERLQGGSDPQLWARLASGWAHLGFRYEEAQARYRRAEALLAGAPGRTSASRTAAGTELAAARAIAAELNAAPLLTDIDDLARRARLSNDPAAQPDPALHAHAQNPLGLTARELDVLTLLARGRSNGQIGKDLLISTKTASTHVSNIIRKLGVTNRVEAAAIAARLGTYLS